MFRDCLLEFNFCCDIIPFLFFIGSKMTKPVKWTEEMEYHLMHLWNEGYSCSVIAKAINDDFGTSFSRAAVVGKSYRMRGKNK